MAPVNSAVVALGCAALKILHDDRRMTKAAADTVQVLHPPVVILVGLDEPVAQECATAMSPIATVKAKDTGRALAQIVTLRPLVVVLRGDEPADVVADVHERAAATGARVVAVGADRGPALRARLEAMVMPREK